MNHLGMKRLCVDKEQTFELFKTTTIYQYSYFFTYKLKKNLDIILNNFSNDMLIQFVVYARIVTITIIVRAHGIDELISLIPEALDGNLEKEKIKQSVSKL